MNRSDASTTRRKFIKQGLLGSAIVATSSSVLYGLSSCNDQKKLGVALVGLGNYATNHLAPALNDCEYVCLKGIVTGTPAKIPEWKNKYNISDKNIYSYSNFSDIAKNDEIDIVYIVLPNSMHAEFTIKAARAGKHIICEKPMAINPQECEAMINACEKANVKLQIGYRLHYEPYNLRAQEIGQSGIYGPLISMNSGLAFNGLKWDNWRFKKELAGGGPMMDVGIYCLQASRYLSGIEPKSFTAQGFKKFPSKFKDIEETLYWQTEFDNGLSANSSTSYASTFDYMFASLADGVIDLKPAFGYTIDGKENGRPMQLKNIPEFEQSIQMDAMALAIKENISLTSSGEEGLQDMRCIAAIYKAMETGKKVLLQS